MVGLLSSGKTFRHNILLKAASLQPIPEDQVRMGCVLRNLRQTLPKKLDNFLWSVLPERILYRRSIYCLSFSVKVICSFSYICIPYTVCSIEAAWLNTNNRLNFFILPIQELLQMHVC